VCLVKLCSSIGENCRFCRFLFLQLIGNFTLGEGVYFIHFQSDENIIIFFLFAQTGRKCNFSAGSFCSNCRQFISG
jgi:hypothetical protein